MDWTAIASAGSDFLGSIINNTWNTASRAGEREHQYQMTDYLYSKDLEQWNRANEYNTPANQMRRFKDAGLNPNLIYGQGTSGNTALPSVSSKQGSGPDFKSQINMGNPIARYQDVEIRRAETDRLKKMNLILDEQRDNAILENVAKAFDMVRQFGYRNFDNLPVKYQDQILASMGYHDYKKHQGKGMMDYQLDQASEDVRVKGYKATELLHSGEIKNYLSQWAKMKVEKMQSGNVNIDKDDLMDRMLSDYFGENANLSRGSLKAIMPIIMKALGK